MILFIIFFASFILSFVTIFIIHNRKNFNTDSLKFTIIKFILLLVCIIMFTLSIVFGIKWFMGIL